MKQYPKSFSDWKNNSGVVLCFLTLLDFKITNIATPFIIEPKMKHSRAAMKPILEANTGMTISGSVLKPSVVFWVSFTMFLGFLYTNSTTFHLGDHISMYILLMANRCCNTNLVISFHFLSLHLVRIKGQKISNEYVAWCLQLKKQTNIFS